MYKLDHSVFFVEKKSQEQKKTINYKLYYGRFWVRNGSIRSILKRKASMKIILF